MSGEDAARQRQEVQAFEEHYLKSLVPFAEPITFTQSYNFYTAGGMHEPAMDGHVTPSFYKITNTLFPENSFFYSSSPRVSNAEDKRKMHNKGLPSCFIEGDAKALDVIIAKAVTKTFTLKFTLNVYGSIMQLTSSLFLVKGTAFRANEPCGHFYEVLQPYECCCPCSTFLPLDSFLG